MASQRPGAPNPPGSGDGRQPGAPSGGGVLGPMRSRRFLIIVAVLFALNIIIGNVLFPADQTKRVTTPYRPTFIAQVKAGNVTDITGKGDSIQATTKKPVAAPGSKDTATHFDTTLPTFISGSSLETLLTANHVTINAQPNTDSRSLLATILISFGPTILLILGFIWLTRRAASAAGGLGGLGLGRSTARLYDAERPGTTFADVAGIEEAKEELEEIVDFLREPAKYQRLGGTVPKGVLLVGAPGTGKTLLARAVAGEARVPFFSISASEFVEMIVGVGAARVRDLFQKARAAAPAIIFIDEIDAIGRQRGGGPRGVGTNDEREQTLNQLLVSLDGFEPSAAVIVLAATNRPDGLDAALLRPGRFDRQVMVDPPDRRGREAILRLHTRGIPLGPGVDLAGLAQATPGMSGADLANLANEAALTAARKGEQAATAQ